MITGYQPLSKKDVMVAQADRKLVERRPVLHGNRETRIYRIGEYRKDPFNDFVVLLERVDDRKKDELVSPETLCNEYIWCDGTLRGMPVGNSTSDCNETPAPDNGCDCDDCTAKPAEARVVNNDGSKKHNDGTPHAWQQKLLIGDRIVCHVYDGQYFYFSGKGKKWTIEELRKMLPQLVALAADGHLDDGSVFTPLTPAEIFAAIGRKVQRRMPGVDNCELPEYTISGVELRPAGRYCVFMRDARNAPHLIPSSLLLQHYVWRDGFNRQVPSVRDSRLSDSRTFN